VLVLIGSSGQARFLHPPFMFQAADFLSQLDKAEDRHNVEVCSTAECLAAGEFRIL
jgi:hypothetical protein